jgi:CheY-like chemotaxis protein
MFAMDARFKILAVDNEPSVTLSLQFAFSQPRYEMLTVDSGAAALARLDVAADFDVIIVDQKMPNQTGVELVGALRERGISSRIIVLSAHVSPDVRAVYEQLQVYAIFSKPFDLGELRAAVDGLAA